MVVVHNGKNYQGKGMGMEKKEKPLAERRKVTVEKE
jgi:hypothetical protein